MNEDAYENIELSDAGTYDGLSRREFLKAVGGGIFIFFCLGEPSAAEAQRRGWEYPEDFNAYLRIGADGRVTCFTGKIEQGQGVITSLAQTLADEIDVALESVDMVMGDTERCPWDMGTFGSLTTRFFGPALRAAGAEARVVLMELASEHLDVPRERLMTEDGVVSDKSEREKRVSYAELAKGKIIERHLKDKPAVKSVSEFKIVGKPMLRRDALEKVTGEAMYAGDIRLEGMLYARIVRPPAHGAKLKSVDTSAAEKMEGIRVVRDGDLVAVLGKSPDGAEKALAKVRAEFDVPEAKVDDKNIFDHLVKSAGKRDVAEQAGDLASGEKLADEVVERTYLSGYVAHAPIEPHTAVAKFEGDKVTVWASTQTPFRLRDEIAEVLGVRSENVRVITPFVGGGFGGKGRNQQGIEAVRVAKLAGRPVQVAWSRAEEFFYDSFRPASVIKVKSGVTKAGKVVLWDFDIYYAGERGSGLFYDVANHRTSTFGDRRGRSGSAHPFATGAWRAPANHNNTFARETQMDVMAAKVGMDPVEFRLKNLSDEKMAGVLKAAAEKFGWTAGKAPSGRGVGVALGIDSGTYVGTIAQVKADKETGRVEVKRVVCVQDMGLVVNPQGAKLQMEGCITMGLGYVLSEEVRFKGGDVLDVNFNTYELPRFSWVPKIETVLIEANDKPPQGGGEPGIICLGGAVGNAIYDATGARVYQLPMTAERVKAAGASERVS
ncbi:MAG: xanthine dehydrogenase family protein molybdopterin-binding subunit [Planctomycetota bacterium]|jgi:isoquinoline 1-oxidoreductase